MALEAFQALEGFEAVESSLQGRFLASLGPKRGREMNPACLLGCRAAQRHAEFVQGRSFSGSLEGAWDCALLRERRDAGGPGYVTSLWDPEKRILHRTLAKAMVGVVAIRVSSGTGRLG